MDPTAAARRVAQQLSRQLRRTPSLEDQKCNRMIYQVVASDDMTKKKGRGSILLHVPTAWHCMPIRSFFRSRQISQLVSTSSPSTKRVIFLDTLALVYFSVTLADMQIFGYLSKWWPAVVLHVYILRGGHANLRIFVQVVASCCASCLYLKKVYFSVTLADMQIFGFSSKWWPVVVLHVYILRGGHANLWIFVQVVANCCASCLYLKRVYFSVTLADMQIFGFSSKWWPVVVLHVYILRGGHTNLRIFVQVVASCCASCLYLKRVYFFVTLADMQIFRFSSKWWPVVVLHVYILRGGHANLRIFVQVVASCCASWLYLKRVRRLESQGLTGEQAEAITAVLTEVLNDSLESISQSFVTKTDMQRSEMLQEASLSNFKGDIQNTQELKVSALQREAEKLRTDMDKMRSEMRYEIDKVTAGHRLDLNLEKGRMREELSNQSQETSNLTNKLDREINTLKTQLEAAKYEVIKYCIGSIVSVTAVGLGLLRIIM